MAGGISWAEGSFPSVTNVTGVTTIQSDGSPQPGAYELQLNTQSGFPTAACNGVPGCTGWEQFIYDHNNSNAYIQDWVLGYYDPSTCDPNVSQCCPSGWNPNNGSCFQNSSAAFVGDIPVTELADVAVMGYAGANDVLTVFVKDTAYSLTDASRIGLAGNWQSAEFNIFGNCCGSEASLTGSSSAPSTIVVQLLTDNASGNSAAPSLFGQSTTGETNNLNLVPSSFCAFSGSLPGIQFEESSVASTAAQTCPLEPVDPNWTTISHPFDGVITGSDTDGTPLLSCRANFNGGVQVGKTRPDWETCDISYGGVENWQTPYETLVPAWADAANGAVPSNAYQLGTDGPGGPPLYVCRAYLPGGGYQLGKVRPGLGACSIPFGGAEQWAGSYQVLTTSLPLTVTPLGEQTAAGNGDIIGGYDSDGTPLYVCAANVGGGLAPGKTRADWSYCDVSSGGQENFVASFSLLTTNFDDKGSVGTIFPAGTDEPGGGALGICRVVAVGSTEVGKYIRSQNICSLPYGGEQFPDSFQVLSF